MAAQGSFRLQVDYQATGDQPQAIDALVAGLEQDLRYQVLLGITGSGKTFTVANVIAQAKRPTLVLAHNKTLAAQLYGEFRELFPDNAVHYFVSYYDYYQPEAYVPASDTYIEKDALVNDDIDRLRHAATQALMSRRDVIIVASVSCIFGIGSTEFYRDMMVDLHVGQTMDREKLLRELVEIQYERNDYDFHRGSFRVRGDIVEIFPAHEEDRAIRVEFFGDEIEAIVDIDPLRGKILDQRARAAIFPSSHYVTPAEQRRRASVSIRDELLLRLQELKKNKLLVEAQRLEQRTLFDLEMLEEMGFCTGIENYSRHLSGRAPGEPPPTLLDYFPNDFLLIIDESHQTLPQIRAMYKGDQSRKRTLVDFGFRLPSALDNRPLRFEEFVDRIHQVIFVSATPGDWEIEQTEGELVEQILRPTGLLDPKIEVRPITNQVDDLLDEIRIHIARNQRILVTTLTKRMAEDLTEYYEDLGLRVRYLHSDIDTMERVEILRDLRQGQFDVLIGINLLREGLDLPEVALVAILDADKEGFLRAKRSLIQTIGRASRNVDGRVLMYADKITESMRYAIDETERRRRLQAAHNARHGITPTTVKRPIPAFQISDSQASGETSSEGGPRSMTSASIAIADIPATIARFHENMLEAAARLDFEEAARLRDEIRSLQGRELMFGEARRRTGERSPQRQQGRRPSRPRPSRRAR